MTYKQAKAELLRQAALSGQTLSAAELREAADYMVRLWRQNQSVPRAAQPPDPYPDFSPEAVQQMLAAEPELEPEE